MSYLPKNKYKVLETSGNEFKFLDGTAYKGKYIETSEGNYAGDSPFMRGPRLFLIDRVTKPQQVNNVFENENTVQYYDYKPSIVEFIKNTKPIISTKTKPSPIDYEKGVYVRYFAKKANTIIDYYEIDRKTYVSFKSKDPSYDFFSYVVGKLLWVVVGDAERSNRGTLTQKERFYPNISSLFPNLMEFSKDKIITDQYAKPGELVYRNNLNKEYIGPYHIHPVTGPMVGAQHVPSSHPRLVFVKDLKKNDTLYIDTKKDPIVHGHDFALDNELATIYTPDPIDLSNQTTGFTLSEEVQERIRQQGGISYTQPTTPTTPSTPSSTTPPSTPSYGGGGGY